VCVRAGRWEWAPDVGNDGRRAGRLRRGSDALQTTAIAGPDT
jgi:hypothetical protein